VGISDVVTSQFALFGAAATWLGPLWQVGVGFAIGVAVLLAVGWLLRLVVPKVAAIAWTTSKEAMSQPLFYVLMAVGIFGLLLFPFIPYNTLGEDIKMVKDEGLTLIMVLSIIMALWTASLSIADEIEGRTALTLLSKPVGRRQFIIGKFLGIVVPVAIMFLVLGAIFLGSISYKVVYDARESALTDPTTADCLNAMISVAPGLVLSFMETIVLTAISVAISTRLPMMANLIICAAIYVLGHLVPVLANSAVGQIEFVRFVANLLAAVLPVLEHFNISASISTGQTVPWDYIAWGGLYCLIYSAVAMLVALLLFEDRDLA
jgi:ABC-type transport system involved in multi-copper enzyme maturation permease subunit